MNECIKIGIMLERQTQFNRSMKKIAYILAFCAVTNKIAHYEMNKKVDKLNKEIEELKSAKGE